MNEIEPTRNTFNKEERLCSKTKLDKLFTEGNSVFVFPFKFIYQPNNDLNSYPAQVVISEPKKNFKKAVDRNKIRRRIREAYRLYKPDFYEKLNQQKCKLSIMILYLDKEIKEYQKIEKGLQKGLKKLIEKIEI